MRARLLIAVAAVAVAASFLGFGRIGGADAATTSGFHFNPGLNLLNTTGGSPGAAEPTIKVDSAGHIYVTGPAGTPTGGCPTWRVHPDTLNSHGQRYDYLGTFDNVYGQNAGGGDCDIAVGGLPRVGNCDNLAFSSLVLSNITVNQSSDCANTFHAAANPVGNPGSWGDDRQWNAADTGLGQVYMAVHDVQTDNIQFATSDDGGYTYVSNTPAINFATVPGALMNNYFTEPVVNPKTHTIYIAFEAGQSASDASSSIVDAIYLAVGTPTCSPLGCQGHPLGPISWTDETVYKWSGTGTPPTYGYIFPSNAIDSAGNVYVSWSDGAHIYMTHSLNPTTAGTFTPPVIVDSKLRNGHSNIMPWIVAGKPGVVDEVWYGSNLIGSGSTCPSGATGVPNDSQGVNNNCFNEWDVHFAQSRNYGQSFTVATARERDHLGSICTQGLNCSTNGGNRNLLDFFQVSLDPAGAANIAYATDLSGTVYIDYTRQCSGLSATSNNNISYSCAAFAKPAKPPVPVCGNAANGYLATVATDPTGDAVNPTGAPGSTSQVDITGVAFQVKGANLETILSVASIPSSPDPNTAGIAPIAGTSDTYYYVTWTYNGTQYASLATEPAPGSNAFSYGTFDPSTNQLTAATATTGTIVAGSPGQIIVNVPLSGVGNPTVPVTSASTAAAQSPYSVVTSGEGAAGTGLVYTHPDDVAPNQGYGTTWSVC